VDFSSINLANLPITSELTELIGNLVKQIPVEVPTMLHPPLVHFAIVLPVIIVLLEIFNVFAKMTSDSEAPRGKTVSALSFFLIILLVIVAIGAYATGSVDGANVVEDLSKEGQTDLHDHKIIGAYIVLSSILLLIFKFISFVGTKTRVLFLVLAIGFTALVMKQGKMGGELVYEHGANVKKVQELGEQLFDTQEELETLKSEKSAASQSSTDLEGKVKELETQKKALEDEVTTLKTKLDDTTKSLEEKAAASLKEAEEKAANALRAAEDKANATIDRIKAEAAKAVEAAKKAATPEPEPDTAPASAGGMQAE